MEGVSLGPWVCFFLHFSRNAVSVEISPLETFPFQGLSHKRLPTKELGAVAQAENSKASVQASETNESASEISSVSICSPLRLKRKKQRKPFYGSCFTKRKKNTLLLFRLWGLDNRCLTLHRLNVCEAPHFPLSLCTEPPSSSKHIRD